MNKEHCGQIVDLVENWKQDKRGQEALAHLIACIDLCRQSDTDAACRVADRFFKMLNQPF